MEPNVTDLPRDRHRETQALLPWYVADRLSVADRSRVDGHLGGCAACRAELEAERRLSTGLTASAAAPLPDVERGWTRMARRLDRETRTPAPSIGERLRRLVSRLRDRVAGAVGRPSRSGWVGLALASQACVVVVLGVAVLRAPAPAAYHALSSPPAARTSQIAVVFRPDTPERSLRSILKANAARLVDGPTEADAYLVAVAPSERAAVLARLRSRHEVVLAEPLDGGTAS